MAEIVLARGDDWEGIYVNGSLVTEGHSIDEIDAMRLVLDTEQKSPGSTLELRAVDLHWLHDFGCLPSCIDEVRWEGE